MHRSSWIVLVLALVIAPGSASAALVFDSFTDQLPANPNLPITQDRVLFLGSRCDADSCPPGEIITHLAGDMADQTGLPGVYRSRRQTTIVADGPPIAADLQISDGAIHGRYESVSPHSAEILYSGGPGNVWIVDLDSLGLDHFEIDVLSVPTAGSLNLRVVARSFREGGGGDAGFHERVVSTPGTEVVRFDQLLNDKGELTCDFSRIYMVFIVVQPSGPAPGSWSLGEFRASASVTPSFTTSWGWIKSNYR